MTIKQKILNAAMISFTKSKYSDVCGIDVQAMSRKRVSDEKKLRINHDIKKMHGLFQDAKLISDFIRGLYYADQGLGIICLRKRVFTEERGAR